MKRSKEKAQSFRTREHNGFLQKNLRRSYGPKIIAALLLAVTLSAMTSCSFGACVKEPYLDSVDNADVFIEMPNLRQYGGYTCGTTCVQMIMNWLEPYDGDINLAIYEELLLTTDEAGTTRENIIGFFDDNGVTYTEHTKMTVPSLVAALDCGHPLMMPIQAWSTADDGTFNTENSDDTATYLIEGHWVICVGYKKTSNGYRFYFDDPACVGYCYLDQTEFEDRWIDMAYDGEVLEKYAIEITATPRYSAHGAFHMD